MKKMITVLLILLMTFSIGGCSAKTTSIGTADSTGTSNSGSGPETNYEKSLADGSLAGPVQDQSAAVQDTAAQPYEQVNGFVLGTSQKIIFRSDMSIETVDFNQALTKINEQIRAAGGYIESSSISGSKTDENNPRYASYLIRVPSKQFESMKKAAGSWGTVISENTSSQDVTKQYIDTESRVKTLKVQEERLLALLSKAQKLDDIILLEGRLSEIRLQIESFTGSLNELDALVDYATISVNLVEVKEIAVAPENFSERILETIKASLKQFGQLTETMVRTLIYMLPYILIIVALALVIRRIGFVPRGFRRKDRNSQDEKLKIDK